MCFCVFFSRAPVGLSRESNSVWQKFLQHGSLRQPWRPFYCLPGRQTDRVKKNCYNCANSEVFFVFRGSHVSLECVLVNGTVAVAPGPICNPTPTPCPAAFHTGNQVRAGASVQKHYHYRPRGCIGQLEIYLFLN